MIYTPLLKKIHYLFHNNAKTVKLKHTDLHNHLLKTKSILAHILLHTKYKQAQQKQPLITLCHYVISSTYSVVFYYSKYMTFTSTFISNWLFNFYFQYYHKIQTNHSVNIQSYASPYPIIHTISSKMLLYYHQNLYTLKSSQLYLSDMLYVQYTTQMKFRPSLTMQL